MKIKNEDGGLEAREFLLLLLADYPDIMRVHFCDASSRGEGCFLSLAQIKDPNAREVLLSWRRRLFYTIFTTFLLLITIPFFISVKTSIEQGNWFLLTLHSIGYAFAVVIVAVRKIPYGIASVAGLLSIFLVGITSLVLFGPIGSGRIWLFAFSLLATLFYGLRGGILTASLNAAVLVVIGLLMNTAGFGWLENPGVTLRMWLITSVSYLFLNGIVVVPMAVLVDALKKRLIQENQLRETVSLARNELAESEEKLYQAIKGSAVPTFLLDGNHVITHWNDACAKITGKSSEEMVGTDNQWVVFGSVQQPVPADVLLMREQGKILENSIFKSLFPSALIPGALEGEVSVSLSGESRVLQCTAASLRNRSGEAVGAIQTFMDITEQKRVEAQLQQSQKMDAIGKLAGGVAHDFNNMLSVILGHADVILENAGTADSAREDMHAIREAAVRSADLTKQLLAFARKMDTVPEVLDLNSVIHDTSRMLRRAIGEDIDLELKAKKGLWPVSMDRSQVDQILANLCVNARDAIDGIGSIVIETSNVVLDEDYCSTAPEAVPGEYVLLAVSDSGRGMNRETLVRVFEPFFTTKEVGHGTGLGLSIVHGIVRQNGGHITVYSEPGSGTTYKVCIPRSKEEFPINGKEAVSELQQGNGEKILLVEDEAAVRNLTKMMLVKLGYRVVEAESPEAAVQMALNPDFDVKLLLTDVVMPGMNGRDLADRLKTMHPDLKFLFISGYTADTLARKGVVESGLVFLAKPFTRQELGAKVRQALEAGASQLHKH